jgi:hypothetical protein
LEVADEALSLREGVLEVADGIDDDDALDGLGAISLLIAAGLYATGLPLVVEVCDICSAPSISSPSSSDFTTSSSSSDTTYLSHSSSTSCMLIGFLFSRLAERHSKQYAQCADVAMPYHRPNYDDDDEDDGDDKAALNGKVMREDFGLPDFECNVELCETVVLGCCG